MPFLPPNQQRQSTEGSQCRITFLSRNEQCQNTRRNDELLACCVCGWQLPGLFDGCSFYFAGEFHPPTAPPRCDLVRLVTLAGAAVLPREPTVDMLAGQSAVGVVPYHAHVPSALANCSHYVVSADQREVAAAAGGRLCRVPPSWIMTCIAEFRLVDRLAS